MELEHWLNRNGMVSPYDCLARLLFRWIREMDLFKAYHLFELITKLDTSYLQVDTGIAITDWIERHCASLLVSRGSLREYYESRMTDLCTGLATIRYITRRSPGKA